MWQSQGMHAARPRHRIHRGDNLDVLAELQGQQYDCIYLDPPYGGGAATTAYSDRFDDWSAYMEPRIELMVPLLAPTGLIVASIDDRQVHHLRILLDRFIGARNFVGTVVWDGVAPNSDRLLSTSHEYLVIYARDRRRLVREGARWKEPRPDAHELLALAQSAWVESLADRDVAQELFSRWRSERHPDLTAGLREYRRLDGEGRLYRVGDAGAPPGQSGRFRKPLIHPVTGQKCPVPRHGWRYDEGTLNQLLADQRIEFGPDGSSLPKVRIYLDEHASQRPRSVFRQVSNGTRYLEQLIDQRVDGCYPKDVDVLARWLGIIASSDPRILDPFLGTGATIEAAMRLNAADGGSRVATGISLDEGSHESNALAARMKASSTQFEGSVGWGHGATL